MIIDKKIEKILDDLIDSYDYSEDYGSRYNFDYAKSQLLTLLKQQALECLPEKKPCEGHKFDYSDFCGGCHKAKGFNSAIKQMRENIERVD